MKPIPGHPGYFADESGNIYSMKPERNRAHLPDKPRRLKPLKNSTGYPSVTLCQGGVRYKRRIHKFILETFVGPRPKGMQCCHNDGNRLNSRLDNLRWDTPKNNHADKIKHGALGTTKLNEMQVRVMRRCVELGLRQKEVARIFGYNRISQIIQRRTWKHI